MKKISTVAFMLPATLALVLCVGCPGGGSGEKGFYRDRKAGFSLSFPEDWSIIEGEMGYHVTGLSPLQGPSDDFRENVSVASSDMERPLDGGAIIDSVIPGMIKMITDFEVEERGTLAVGGREAAWIRYNHRQGQFRLVSTVYGIAGEKRAFLVYCTGRRDQADRFEEVFRQVVESFRVLK